MWPIKVWKWLPWMLYFSEWSTFNYVRNIKGKDLLTYVGISRWAWTLAWSCMLINFLVSTVVHPAHAIVYNSLQQRTLLKAIYSNEHQRPTWCSLLWLINGSRARVFYSWNQIEATSRGGLAQWPLDPDHSQCAFGVNTLIWIQSGLKPVWKPSVNMPLVSRGQTLLFPVLHKRPAEEKGLGGFLWRLLVDTYYCVVGKMLVRCKTPYHKLPILAYATYKWW